MTRLKVALRRPRLLRRYPHLDAVKLEALDFAFTRCGARSFADLGGVWGVHGGYACYAVEMHAPRRGVLVDEDLSLEARRRAERLPGLELVEGTLGSAEVVERVGAVDAILLFDVLLHQVRPDWNELLELYAPRTRSFVIVQPQWNGPDSLRLLDLGEEGYRKATLAHDPDLHGRLFERLDEINERRGRPWRDVHDVWQWGITDADLVATMRSLGFSCVMRRNAGPWSGRDEHGREVPLERFHKGAFVFAREG